MSTRCQIVVKDTHDTIVLYRHSDGYPDGEHGVPATIGAALQYAWPLPRYEAMDFAAAIVRGLKESGGNIYIDGGGPNLEEKDFKAMLHGDIEWLYVVRMDGKQLVLDVHEVDGFGRDKQII